MRTYTRLLVIGTVQKASMVVPADEPLAGHVATIADVVSEPHGVARLALVDVAGREIDTALSLGDLGLIDGAQLRLVRSADVPAPPEVTDVTDAVAQERTALTRGWSQAHRIAVASSGGALAAFAGLSAARAEATWLPVTVWALVMITAVVAGLMGHAVLRAVMTGLAVGSAVAVAPLIPEWADATGDLLVTATAAAVLVWLSLGLGSGWGGRHLGAGVGSLVGALLSAGALAPLLLGADAAETFAIVGVVALLGLGAVPSVALAVSGLTRLDDAADAGTRPARATVALGVESAYAVMTWSVVALAVATGASAFVLLSTGELWPQLVAAALVIVTLLRTRVMALARQAWALWVAGTVGTFAGLAMSGETTLLWSVAIVAAVIAIVGAVATPPEHTRIRLRGWGDTVEALCAIAVVPCVIGLFGVYGFMLEVFS
ncbi:hypothetical protein [Demequina muriae]|uniref:EccD-like transmembrane domain-containing protein n=1 Tax=Demequina muriae TaxID=3051664 RepID=A0ABT8GFQ2_9MICO|nr:hypothetical protein [Demequina sp. EGI L300058]MDN4480268.1 hypothetical protein [Demequina sp. EGI L300058]